VQIEAVDSTLPAQVGLLPGGSRRDLILVLLDGYETSTLLSTAFLSLAGYTTLSDRLNSFMLLLLNLVSSRVEYPTRKSTRV